MLFVVCKFQIFQDCVGVGFGVLGVDIGKVGLDVGNVVCVCCGFCFGYQGGVFDIGG